MDACQSGPGSVVRTVCALFGVAFACLAHAQTSAGVLSDARAAAGGSAWSQVAEISSEASELSASLEARCSLREDVHKGRFAQTCDFGVFRTADVFDGVTRWRVDRSGGVHPLNGAFSKEYATTDAWLARRGYLKSGAEGATIEPPSQRGDGERRYIVMTARPSGGTSVELWFGQSSHLLERIVRERPVGDSIESFSDYRHVSGLMLPFRITSGNEDEPGRDTISVTRYTVSRVASPGTPFAKPSALNDTSLSFATQIPVEIDGQILVYATLNDVGPLGFILDTGGHNIITPAVARQLGLVPVGNGHSGGAGEGQIAEQDVRIARLKIGGAVLSDQHFYVIPLSYATVERGSKPPLAGILGLELFERLQVRIDYAAKLLWLTPPAEHYGCHGTNVALLFDDDMPLVDGLIDGVRGVVGIDTGNGGSTIVQGIWARNQGLAESLRRGIETVSFGAGGASYNWISRGHSVGVGGAAAVTTELRYAEDKKGSFASRTEAANAGYYFLANFGVSFDYSSNVLCLERAAPFALPPMNRSGMGMSKDDPTYFTIVQVRDSSPAAAAGLRKGDRVIAVDHQSATELGRDEVFQIVRRAVGSRIHLDLLRDGVALSTDIVLDDPH